MIQIYRYIERERKRERERERYFYFRFFTLISYYKILSIVPCAI